MAEAKKTAPTAPKVKKIVDIAHPGTSAPATNSKSVIITHHPAMQDPMVTSDVEAAPESMPIAAPAAKVVLKPLADSELLVPIPAAVEEPAAEPTQAVDSEDVPHSAADAPAPVTPDTTVPSPVMKPDKEVSPPIASGSSDAKLGTKEIQTESEAAAAEDAEAKRKAELAVMIENKKFYLPINSSESQRTKEFVASGIVLSILLGLIWIDIALDAGIIHLSGIKALTHFFN